VYLGYEEDIKQRFWGSVVARYSLAKHVFVCRDEGYIVVLDLHEDRYFSLDAERTAVLIPFLTGWPASGMTPGVDGAPSLEEVASPLLTQGWLLEGDVVGKSATPVSIAAPHVELLDELDGSRPKVDLRAVIAFCAASVRARLLMRVSSLERIVYRVATRKARAVDDGAHRVDLERARQLMRIFDYLRVFLFSHREECLRDSLAVLEFLAGYGIFPDWVFGVRARPFVAHCWVQHDGIVLNDTAEHAGGYVPIMVV
jgi:Transglutaminase-like superfamily